MDINREAMDGKSAKRYVRMIPIFGFSFSRFLRHSLISDERGLIILRSHDHANIGTEDLKSVTTLIALRRLNLIKHLEMFLSSLVHILPPNTNFIGCFSPERAGRSISAEAGAMVRLIDSILHRGMRDFHILNSKIVSEILEMNGLKIINMTETNGLTYFHSRKISGQPGMTA